jgi:hypothetical protein
MKDLHIVAHSEQIYDIQGLGERAYIVRLISVDGNVIINKIHVEDFEAAYQRALEFLSDKDIDRIISIEEVLP